MFRDNGWSSARNSLKDFSLSSDINCLAGVAVGEGVNNKNFESDLLVFKITFS